MAPLSIFLGSVKTVSRFLLLARWARGRYSADNLWASVVSVLSSSKVLACSLMIKEFCGGKPGWNDRAIFTETHLKPASEPVWPQSGIHKSLAKFCPMLCPLESLILGNQQVTTHLSLPVQAFARTYLLLPIGHFGGLRVLLSYRKNEGLVCLTPLMEYLMFVVYIHYDTFRYLLTCEWDTRWLDTDLTTQCLSWR